jgi:glycosyltransferase involved in cell wall biosynthesis
MTILAIDYTPAVRQRAGIGRLVRGQIQALLSLPIPFDVRLFVVGSLTAAERHEAEIATGLPIHSTPMSERNMVRLWHRLGSPVPSVDRFLGGVSGVRPDLLHATDFVLPPTRARRTLVTVHDLAFLFYPNAAMPGLQRYLNVVVPRSVRRADHLLADSHNTAKDLHEQWQVDPATITVVQGGVDHEHFQPVTDAVEIARVRSQYGLGDAPYIFALSRLEPRKNFVRLIEAFARARADARLLHNLVIGGGKGWLYDEIFARVQELGVTECVHFPGFIADGDLPALFSGAEFFAYPSLYEGFGLPIVEALACGVAVLTANNSCLPEAGGSGAIYVNALDTEEMAAAIVRLATDRTLRTDLAAAGIQHAAHFTWQRSAQQLLDAYRKLL